MGSGGVNYVLQNGLEKRNIIIKIASLRHGHVVQCDATLTEERVKKLFVTAVKSVLSSAVPLDLVSLPRT